MDKIESYDQCVKLIKNLQEKQDISQRIAIFYPMK